MLVCHSHETLAPIRGFWELGLVDIHTGQGMGTCVLMPPPPHTRDPLGQTRERLGQ